MHLEKVTDRSRLSAEATLTGSVDYVTWLSSDQILIAGWFYASEGAQLQAALVHESEVIPLDICWIAYPRWDIPMAGPQMGKVLVARISASERDKDRLGSLLIRTDNTVFELMPSEVSQVVTDLQTVIRDVLSPLSLQKRTAILELLNASVHNQPDSNDRTQLSKHLYALREALRQRLDTCQITPDQPQGLHIESLVALSERAFYIQGWMRDTEAPVARLTAVAPEGSRTELIDRLVRYPRLDVERFYNKCDRPCQRSIYGFVCYFETKATSYLPTGWVVELCNSAGSAVETVAPRVISDHILGRTMILEGLPIEVLPNETLMAKHVFPAVTQLQERCKRINEVENVVQYGMPYAAPEVSIIVPLYGRIDFVEQQLAQFTHDPLIAQSDLIYVLDSPELAGALRDAAATLCDLYGVPFRIVTLNQSVGYSAANNAGVAYARGRLLLLLNSDVLPDTPGWLGKLITFYDVTSGIGALGPKLLYEDDSLQHAGMYFHLPKASALANIWQNMHYFKGLHRHLPLANIARSVPAVTGACLMIATDLYRHIGGLQDSYLQGDHEDSDLCLRLLEAGYKNWYLPDVELYHLEGQSYSDSLRGRNALYNRWLHTHFWDARIAAIMESYPFPRLADMQQTSHGWPQHASVIAESIPGLVSVDIIPKATVATSVEAQTRHKREALQADRPSDQDRE